MFLKCQTPQMLLLANYLEGMAELLNLRLSQFHKQGFYDLVVNHRIGSLHQFWNYSHFLNDLLHSSIVLLNFE
jgi:hypothetical protein